MKILITGGNGYVGRTLARLLYDDHDVTVLDSLRWGVNRFDEREASRFRFVRQDITDAVGLCRVFHDIAPDVVIHLAAIHFIPECDAQPGAAVAVNAGGTANVCQACAEGTALVFTSSAAVYAPQDHATSETSPVGPTDIYGLSKLHGEEYVQYWTCRKNLRTAIVRLFNVIGPGETNPHVVPAIINQILMGHDPLQLGNCHPQRDYIDVEDVAHGIAAVAFGLSAAPGVDIVNLGTGASHSVADLVEELGRIVGRDLAIACDQTRVRPSDRPMLKADIARLKSQYGWAPQIPIGDTLRRTWMDPDVLPQILARS